MKKTILYGLVLALLIPSLTFASFDSSLKYGSKGDAVSELQDFLQDQGYLTGKIDGKFGLGTRKAVIAWQSANNLSADGYFGALSRQKASEQLTAELQPSLDAEQKETGTVSAPLMDGCKSTDGFSLSTGKKCDGTFTPSQVTDTTTQAQLSALAAQLQAQQNALNQIAQNTNSLYNPPMTTPTPITHNYDLKLGFGDDNNPDLDALYLNISQKPTEVMMTLLDNGLLTSDIGTTGEILVKITSDTPQYWTERKIYLSGIQDGSNPHLKDGFNEDINGSRTSIKYQYLQTGYLPISTPPAGTYHSIISIPALNISKGFNIIVK